MILRVYFQNYVRENSLYCVSVGTNCLQSSLKHVLEWYFLLLICSHSHKQCLTRLHAASPRFGDFFMSLLTWFTFCSCLLICFQLGIFINFLNFSLLLTVYGQLLKFFSDSRILVPETFWINILICLYFLIHTNIIYIILLCPS